MIIGTCGFCSTGSSAVSDYLREFDENQVIDRIEFTIPYLPDGLEDLQYHLCRNTNRDDNCSIAIPRFRRFMKFYERQFSFLPNVTKKDARKITNDFLDSLIQLRWISSRRSDKLLYPSGFYFNVGHRFVKNILFRKYYQFFHKSPMCWPYRILDVSVRPSNFDVESKKFVRKILELYGADFTKNIVLDQPFIGNDPVKSFKFFDNPIAIVVDRDPRDNFIFSREVLSKKGRFMPSDNVEEFVEYYKLMRQNQPYLQPNERVLRMNFEEMVYDYDNATRKVREFCHLHDNPRPRSIFNPQMSMANTQLFLKFPEYQKDVEYIERELADYLFDFEKYPKPEQTGKMFMGKSPLNK